MELKSSRYLTPSFNPPTTHEILNKIPKQEEELEFDESDVVWSSSSSPEKTTTVKTAEIPAISVTSAAAAAGLSAALLSTGEPQSPTSIQRKTTSSPVSMISSSGLTGYYYGRKVHQSAPVNVPVWPTGLGRSRRAFGLARFDEVDDFIDDDDYDDDDDDDDDDGEMVPPHEIVARSHKTTSFSVVEGAGRTLKGRDLTTVRNSVFHKTGFLQ